MQMCIRDRAGIAPIPLGLEDLPVHVETLAAQFQTHIARIGPQQQCPSTGIAGMQAQQNRAIDRQQRVQPAAPLDAVHLVLQARAWASWIHRDRVCGQ